MVTVTGSVDALASLTVLSVVGALVHCHRGQGEGEAGRSNRADRGHIHDSIQTLAIVLIDVCAQLKAHEIGGDNVRLASLPNYV